MYHNAPDSPLHLPLGGLQGWTVALAWLCPWWSCQQLTVPLLCSSRGCLAGGNTSPGSSPWSRQLLGMFFILKPTITQHCIVSPAPIVPECWSHYAHSMRSSWKTDTTVFRVFSITYRRGKKMTRPNQTNKKEVFLRHLVWHLEMIPNHSLPDVLSNLKHSKFNNWERKKETSVLQTCLGISWLCQ